MVMGIARLDNEFGSFKINLFHHMQPLEISLHLQFRN